MRFSGPVTALRVRVKGKGKGKVKDRLSSEGRSTPESSHGSVTPTPNKLLPTGDISHSLAGVELSSTNSLPDTTVSNLDKYTTFSFTPWSINPG